MVHSQPYSCHEFEQGQGIGRIGEPYSLIAAFMIKDTTARLQVPIFRNNQLPTKFSFAET